MEVDEEDGSEVFSSSTAERIAEPSTLCFTTNRNTATTAHECDFRKHIANTGGKHYAQEYV